MQARGRKKLLAQTMVLSMLRIADKKEDTEVKKSFWNTYHCQGKIVGFEGRYYGTYCKNRVCPICSGIRKADIINRYLPVMQTWEAPHLVTLTIKTIGKATLQKAMEKMIEGITTIIEKYKKRSQRGTDIRLVGIRALECTYNPVTHKYHPHFHIIVASKEISNILVKEWLKKWSKGWSSRYAQHVRPVGDLEADLIETVKYGSKIFTDPEGKRKLTDSADNSIYAAAHYNIFAAMKGLRIFERFGFNLPKETQIKPIGARVVSGHTEWIYLPQYMDWQNAENELVLAAYTPKPELLRLLENNINLESE